jgi:hypothetical protein
MNRREAPRAASLAVCAFFAVACQGTSGGRGSETHWLAPCAPGSTCGGDLKCLCGTCTLPCSATPDCRPLGDTAACATTVATGEACRGSTEPAPRVCLERCSTQSGCLRGLVCVEGTCVPPGARDGGRNGVTDAAPARGGSAGTTNSIDGSSGGAGGENGRAGAGDGGGGRDAGRKPDAGSVSGTGGTRVLGGDIVTASTADHCADPTQLQPLVAEPGETCYEFPVHGISSPTDRSKFTVPSGRTFNQFYYSIPWPAGTLATRFGARFDNLVLLRHWLAFGISSGEQAPGTVQRLVTGSALGLGAELIGGWAVGDCNVTLPKNMGLKLPASGQIMIQWNHDNATGGPAQDGTVVQFCTVAAGGRPDTGGITLLGTENINGLSGLSPGVTSKSSGTCPNNSGRPITIVAYNPQMNALGTNMRSVVTHINGTSETVFDHAFRFDHQVNYLLNPGYVLQPGEKITSTCTFSNTTAEYVTFDTPSTVEMCSQLVLAYPYGALNDGVISLTGATNSCW